MYRMTSTESKPRILVLTLAIGADYRKNLKKALDSKKSYCERHGYTYKEIHEEGWHRERPISWSKVLLYMEYAKMTDMYDYIWASDADVWITNPSLRLEDHVLPLLPANKNLLLTYDSCQHVNAGNIIFRTGQWAIQFFQKVWDQTDCIYHIWWETKAICDVMASSPEDVAYIETTMKAYVFNAYLMGYKGTRLWQPDDFLVHFAGVYDSKKMLDLMEAIERGETPRLSMFG
jgi:galactosyl transferase GMA12/MNN10 family